MGSPPEREVLINSSPKGGIKKVGPFNPRFNFWGEGSIWISPKPFRLNFGSKLTSFSRNG